MTSGGSRRGLQELLVPPGAAPRLAARLLAAFEMAPTACDGGVLSR